MSDNKKVLFLDDMEERHKAFKHVLRFKTDIDFTYVYTALDAINALDTHHFDQAFLDHDLSIDDIMCEPGDHEAMVPTGMAVVNHILTMERPPGVVVVHSLNGPAADEMVLRLNQHPIRSVPFFACRVPFNQLLKQIA